MHSSYEKSTRATKQLTRGLGKSQIVRHKVPERERLRFTRRIQHFARDMH